MSTEFPASLEVLVSFVPNYAYSNLVQESQVRRRRERERERERRNKFTFTDSLRVVAYELSMCSCKLRKGREQKQRINTANTVRLKFICGSGRMKKTRDTKVTVEVHISTE